MEEQESGGARWWAEEEREGEALAAVGEVETEVAAKGEEVVALQGQPARMKVVVAAAE